MTESANAALNAPKLQCSPYEVTIPHYIFISSSPELKPCVLEVGSPISCYFGDFWLSVKVRQETQELQAVLKCSFFLFVSTETETCLLSLPAAAFRKTQVGSHFHLMSCFYFSRNLHSARCLKKKKTPQNLLVWWEHPVLSSGRAVLLLPICFFLNSSWFTHSPDQQQQGKTVQRENTQSNSWITHYHSMLSEILPN